MKRFNRIFIRISVFTAVVVSSILLLNAAFPLAVPNQQQLYAQVVTARDGRPLRAFADKEGVWRYQISSQQVSPLYIEALLTYEDRWFYQHPGINPLALARASWQNFINGEVISGGSTLSMQVARLLHPHSRSLLGKFQQIFRTLQLEWQLDKRQILELYLNIAPFGGTIQGVQAASFAYLGKPALELTAAEAALLAVLPQAPSRLRPDRHPERATRARDKVLNRMLQRSVWSAAQVAEAKQEQIYATQPRVKPLAPLLARQLVQQHQSRSVIKTTLDYSLQSAVAGRVADYVNQLPEQSSAAVLVVDNKTQAVLAYQGSSSFNDADRFGHVDMTQAVRSPGSTLKPFIYALALDEGLIHSASLLSDTPRYWSDYQPDNFSGGFAGPVSATEALQRSLNVPAVNLLERYGSQRFHDQLANAGVTLTHPGKPNLATILGGAGLNLRELISLYLAFSNEGMVTPLRFLAELPSPEPRYLLSPNVGWVIHRMLTERPSNSARLSLGRHSPLAIKTGTSYGFRDSWAIGFSKEYTLGVWVGRPDGTPMPGHYGRITAVPLLQQISRLLPPLKIPDRPQNVAAENICWPSGIPVQPDEPCPLIKQAWLLDSAAPPTWRSPELGGWQARSEKYWLNSAGERVLPRCADDYKEYKTERWPAELTPWLKKLAITEVSIAEWSAGCAGLAHSVQQPLRIKGLKEGLRLRSLGKQANQPVIKLSSMGGEGKRRWYINGEHYKDAEPNQVVEYVLQHKGRYEVVLMDEQGKLDRVQIYSE